MLMEDILHQLDMENLQFFIFCWVSYISTSAEIPSETPYVQGFELWEFPAKILSVAFATLD